MRYFVADKHQEHTTQFEQADGTTIVKVEGPSVAPLSDNPKPGQFAVDLEAEPDCSVVLLDGKVYEVFSSGVTVKKRPPVFSVNGRLHAARLEHEQQRSRELLSRKNSSGSRALIRAQMPGRVVKVCVEVGAEVEAGAALVVLEAMKMENELQADGSGKVVEIFVKAGDPVEAGAQLLRLD